MGLVVWEEQVGLKELVKNGDGKLVCAGVGVM